MAQRVGERDVGIFPSGNPPIYTTSTIVLLASVPILSSLFKNDALFSPPKTLLIISRAREKNHFDILMRGSVLQCMCMAGKTLFKVVQLVPFDRKKGEE